MKRSHTIALAALGVVGAAVLLTGEDPPRDEGTKDAALYANVDECVRANVLGRETCEAEFRTAQEKYLAEAPKFPEKNACETNFGAGQCKPAQVNGASVFVPAMLGFMVGNYLSNARQTQALLPPRMAATACPPGVTPVQQPGCTMPRQSSGTSASSAGAAWRSYSTSSGHTVSRQAAGNGTAKVPAATARGTAPRSTPATGHSSSASSVTRGGFGSTAHSSSHSSGG